MKARLIHESAKEETKKATPFLILVTHVDNTLLVQMQKAINKIKMESKAGLVSHNSKHFLSILGFDTTKRKMKKENDIWKLT